MRKKKTRAPGRPPLYADGPLERESAWLSAGQRAWLGREAKRLDRSRSEILRELLDAAMLRARRRR